MKRLLLVICIMFSITLNAQSDFYFGPKVGYKRNINVKDNTLSPIVHYKDISNITLGAYGRLMFDNFIIQPELMYNYIAIKTFQCTGPVTISKNHSFILPIYFGYQFINRDNFNMRANIGPVVNFNFDKYTNDLLSVDCCGIDNHEDQLSGSIQTSFKYWDYNFANLGAAFSLGADIYRFTIDLGYSLGLTKVFYNGIVHCDKIYPANNIVRQNTLTFTVGYRFGE